MNKQEILKQCTVDGFLVRLPDIKLDRKLYMEVSGAIGLIGGKWKGGKVMGFEFREEPTELLSQIQNGEKRNLKKEFQFYATPDDLADELVMLANPSTDDEILEPSAGDGAIVKAINKKLPNKQVDCYELMPLNQESLKKIPTVNLLGDDFLKSEYKHFDKIIANPPFQKNLDIIHVRKMYDCLVSGGRLVSVTSRHWRDFEGKKEKEFKAWVQSVGATIKDVDAGRFKKSGTNTSSLIIIINKK